MKFRLEINKTAEEEIRAVVHEPSELTEQIETLVRSYEGNDRLFAYNEEKDMLREMSFEEVECIAVIDGKTCLIDHENGKYLCRKRLYELEDSLPGYFIRINKSALANRHAIAKFDVLLSGAVNVHFRCGYRDYVSRRCFAEIKRRFGVK